MEYDIATGSWPRMGDDVDNDGIAWVSGRGGTRGLTEPVLSETAFLLEVAGATPHMQDVATPAHADWSLA